MVRVLNEKVGLCQPCELLVHSYIISYSDFFPSLIGTGKWTRSQSKITTIFPNFQWKKSQFENRQLSDHDIINIYKWTSYSIYLLFSDPFSHDTYLYEVFRLNLRLIYDTRSFIVILTKQAYHACWCYSIILERNIFNQECRMS